MLQLILSNIRKSRKTSMAFWLLSLVTVLLADTASQMTEGFGRLYWERAAQTNSADFAAVLPKGFCEKYEREMGGILSEKEAAKMEFVDAVLVKNADVQIAGSGLPIYGSWIFRNADRGETLSRMQVVERMETLPDNAIYVPYVCKTFFGFALGDTLSLSAGTLQQRYTIAGFTEDVLFGCRADIAFDLPGALFEALREQAGADADAVIVQTAAAEDVTALEKRFSEWVASKSAEAAFYSYSDVEYARSSRESNLSIYVAVLKGAAWMGAIACLIVIAFHMRSTLDRDLEELGTLKAIGWQGGAVAATYVLQFLGLGLSGAVFGILLSQKLTPLVVRGVATDIGFVWNTAFLGWVSVKNFLAVPSVTALVTLFLARGIIRLRPVEAFQGNCVHIGCAKNRAVGRTIARMPFPVNFSIVCRRMDYERVKSVLVCTVVAAMMCVAGFAVILYARLVCSQDGLLQITGAEVYDVHVEAAQSQDTKMLAEELRAGLDGLAVQKVATAIDPGYTKLMCEGEVYASLSVHSDYDALENPSVFSGRYPIHENEAAVSGNLARLSGKGIGDSIVVSQVFQEEARTETFLIVGLTQGTYSGGLDIALTMEGLRRIDPAADWTSIHIYLEDGMDAGAYCLALEERYGERLAYAGAFAQVFQAQFAPITNSVAGVVYLVTGAVFLLIVIMGFFVTNAILLTQRRDFGIMKALGYLSAQLAAQAVMTYMLHIAGGSVLGSVLLYFGSNAVMSGLFRAMGVYKVAFSFPAAWILVLVLGMEAAGGLTALAAARKIRKIAPCEVLSI